jgi:hypothetical protein
VLLAVPTTLVGVTRPIGTTAAPQLSQTQEIKLGEYTIRDSKLLDAVGWDSFVVIKGGKPDLTIWGALEAHLASHMLGHPYRPMEPQEATHHDGAWTTQVRTQVC